MIGGVWILLGYALGSLPTAYWMGRALRGIDIRTVGSGNVGATNVFRSVGRGAGIATLLIDMVKGWLPVFLCLRFGPGGLVPVAVGVAAVLGHSGSPWVGFRGGKGVATSGGVFIALLPGPMLFAVLAFAVGFGLSRRVSVGSLLAAVTLPAVAFWRGAPSAERNLALILGLFVVYKHIPNMRRLMRGEEPPVRFGNAENRAAP
ncbi:MAG: glycerol-3-phosphate 1-O-acyltransferase PlsY [Elusimicrobia bacterium]|nr:glycerol-3-phosphate 1-O-acyltransferase PlsY [Elusimicrobiota bacterium]